MGKFIYYLPRILSVLITIFFSIFILEGFDPEFGWQSGLAHGALAAASLIASIIAWRWPGIGGWLFAAFGVWYLWSISVAGWWGGMIIGGIPLLAGILFLAEWFGKNRTAKGESSKGDN